MNANDSTLSLTQSDTTEVLLGSVEAELELPVLTREPTRHINHENQKHLTWTGIQCETAPSTQWNWPRTQITNREQQILFANKGYKIIKTLSNTLQGQLYKAQVVKPSKSPHPAPRKYVAIKRTDKHLHNRQITVEDGTSLCVSENIIKEAHILKYLTIANAPIGDYITRFIDFFESHSSYYLVMEYVASEMNLKQFVCTAQQYIETGALSIHEYQRIMRYLLWQLCVTIVWCHKVQCAHLDLCLENIMLQNVRFIGDKNGVSIDTKICIKLCDFGASEAFEGDMFWCMKDGLSIDNECYLAPNVFNGFEYDARSADCWCLGIILFECMTVGKHLYGPRDMYSLHSGYYALQHGQLKQYLLTNDLLSYFSADAFSLVSGLLRYDERYRLNGMRILTHQWFKMYAKAYSRRIRKKFYVKKHVDM
eukprot:133694_1